MNPLFLQESTLGKLPTDAIGKAGQHASEAGPLTYIWFMGTVVFAALCIYFYLKADKASAERNKVCEEAVATAKIEWARQQAIDNGYWENQVKELKAERRDLLDRLERINHELRQQEGKSIDVMGGLRNALNQVNQLLAVVNQRLEQIETYLNTGTRRPVAPIVPFSSIPGLSPDVLQP